MLPAEPVIAGHVFHERIDAGKTEAAVLPRFGDDDRRANSLRAQVGGLAEGPAGVIVGSLTVGRGQRGNAVWMDDAAVGMAAVDVASLARAADEGYVEADPQLPATGAASGRAADRQLEAIALGQLHQACLEGDEVGQRSGVIAPVLVGYLVVIGRVEPVFLFELGPVLVGSRPGLRLAHLVDAGRGVVEDGLVAEDGDGPRRCARRRHAFFPRFDQRAPFANGEHDGGRRGDDVTIAVVAARSDVKTKLRAHDRDLLCPISRERAGPRRPAKWRHLDLFQSCVRMKWDLPVDNLASDELDNRTPRFRAGPHSRSGGPHRQS